MSKIRKQGRVLPEGVLHVSASYPSAGRSLVEGVPSEFSMQAEVISLDGDGQIRIVEADGKVTLIPIRFMPVLGMRGDDLAAKVATDVSHLRKLETLPILKELGLVSQETVEPSHYSVKGERVALFGTPVLEWMPGVTEISRYRPLGGPREDGWRLIIAGNSKVILGFAPWDKPEQLRNLIRSMGDVDALHAMAALIDPSGMAKVTARWLKVKRKNIHHSLPGLRPAPFIRALAAAGLTLPEGTPNPEKNGGYITPVPVVRFGEPVTVVLAIKAPRVFDSKIKSLEEWYGVAAEALRREGLFNHKDILVPESEKDSSGVSEPLLWGNRLTGRVWASVLSEVNEFTPSMNITGAGSVRF